MNEKTSLLQKKILLENEIQVSCLAYIWKNMVQLGKKNIIQENASQINMDGIN